MSLFTGTNIAHGAVRGSQDRDAAYPGMRHSGRIGPEPVGIGMGQTANLAQSTTSFTPTPKFCINGGLTSGLSQYSRTRWDENAPNDFQSRDPSFRRNRALR